MSNYKFPEVSIKDGAIFYPDTGKFTGSPAEEADALLIRFEDGSLELPGEFPERITLDNCFTQGAYAARILLNGCTAEYANQKVNYSLSRRAEIIQRQTWGRNNSAYFDYCLLQALANDIQYGYRFNASTEAEALSRLRVDTERLAASDLPETTRYAAISANAALTAFGFSYHTRHTGSAETPADPERGEFGVQKMLEHLNTLLDNALKISRPDLRVMSAERILMSWKKIKSAAITSFHIPFADEAFNEKIGRLLLNPDNALDSAEMMIASSFSGNDLQYKGKPLLHFRNLLQIIENLQLQISDGDSSRMVELLQMINTRLVREANPGFYGDRDYFYSFTPEDADIAMKFSDAGVRIPPELRQKINRDIKRKRKPV